MAISLGGIQFSIGIRTGNTVAQINRVTQSLTALSQAATTASPVLHQLQQGFSHTATTGTTAQQSISATGRQARQTSEDFSSLAQAVVAVSGALGAGQIVGFIKDVTLLAGRVQNLGTVMQNTGATANYSQGELELLEAKVKRLGITTQAAREIMTRFAQNNLDVADSVKLARIAQDAAVISGVNSSEAADKMATAIFRLDTRMLRNQGILINLRQEYQAYGLATGRVETSLTATEKQQIALSAVLRAGVNIAGNYEKSLNDAYKQYTSLVRYQEEAARTLGELFLPALGQVVSALRSVYEGFTNASSGVRSLAAVATGFAASFALASTAVAGTALALRYLLPVLGATAKALSLITQAVFAANGALLVLSRIPKLGVLGLITLGITAVGTAWSYFSARTAEAQRKLSDAAKEASAAGARLFRLQESVKTLKAMAESADKSALSQDSLKLQMRGVADLVPEYSAELLAASDSVAHFLSVLEAKEPRAFVSLQDSIEASQKKLVELEALASPIYQRILEIESRFKNGNVPGLQAIDLSEQLDNLRQHHRSINAEYLKEQDFLKSLQDTASANDRRFLDSRAQQQETAVQLALRVSGRLAEAELKHINDRGVEIIGEYLSVRKDLLANQLTDAELRKFQIDDRRQLDAMRRNENESEEDFKKRKIDFQQSSEDEHLKRLADQKIIRDSFAQTSDIAIRSLELEADSVKDLQEENRLLSKGILPDVISATLELQSAREKAKRADERYKLVIEEINDKLKEQQKILESPAQDKTATEARATAEQKIAAIKEELNTVLYAQQLASEKAAAIAVRGERLKTEAVRRGKLERLREAADEADKLLKVRRDQIASTDRFLANKSVALTEGRAPGFSQLVDLIREFEEAIRGAGSRDQIERIRSIFDPSLQKLFRDLSKSGNTFAASQLLKEAKKLAPSAFNEATQVRLEELAKEDAQIRIATEQLSVLVRIYETLRNPTAKPENADSDIERANKVLRDARGLTARQSSLAIDREIVNRSFGRRTIGQLSGAFGATIPTGPPGSRSFGIGTGSVTRTPYGTIVGAFGGTVPTGPPGSPRAGLGLGTGSNGITGPYGAGVATGPLGAALASLGGNPNTPFDAGVGRSFEMVKATAAKATEALEGLSKQVVGGFGLLATELQKQAEISSKTSANLDSLQKSLQQKEREADRAMRGRGL